MTLSKEIRWIRLGDFIHQLDERNKDSVYSLDDLRGLSIQKVFIHTKAKMDGVSLTAYKLVPPKAFCYVTITSRNSDKITLALNETDNTYIVSSSYIVFYCLPKKKLLPEYLYLWFNMPEFDRYARFNSWGSARESFSWQSMQLIQVPVPYQNGEPDIERQQEIVDIWQGLRRLKEENEAIAQPLLDILQAKIDELKHSAPMVRMGRFIKQRREKYDGNNKLPIRGVSREGFIFSKQKEADLSKYNVFYKNDFVFNPARMEVNSIALNIEYDKGICSSLYEIFEITDTSIYPEYLNIFIKRDEFARHCEYLGWGSAREYCRVADISQIEVPIPDEQTQLALVEISRCARRAKEIAEEATQHLKSICPALMQHIIHS